jgi:hypothetical protein
LTVRPWSKRLPIITAVLLVLYLSLNNLFRGKSSVHVALYSVGSLCQYGLVASLFIKLMISGWDLPVLHASFVLASEAKSGKW